jgi:hypothetical protein
MFKSPPDKRSESLRRITRNKKIYLAIFYKSDPLKIKVIYEIPLREVLAETERQLDRSRNRISHVGFSEDWVSRVGTVVYTDENQSGVQ